MLPKIPSKIIENANGGKGHTFSSLSPSRTL